MQTTTVAVACTTGVYTLLLSRLSGRESTRGKIGVARTQCSNTQDHHHCSGDGCQQTEPYGPDHMSPPSRIGCAKTGRQSGPPQRVAWGIFASERGSWIVSLGTGDPAGGKVMSASGPMAARQARPHQDEDVRAGERPCLSSGTQLPDAS